MAKKKIVVRKNASEIGSWKPIIGTEFSRFINSKNLPPVERENIEKSTLSILSQCTPPISLDQQQTGLVMGLVQSGKTMSFTAVTALARDNGYRLIVIITGTTEPLSKQSNDRIFKDLDVASFPGVKWYFSANPKKDAAQKIEDLLAVWGADPKVQNFKQTIVITVMKNWRHIDHLNALLKKIDTSNFSTIVIDDEADQASINTKPQQSDESTTYASILELRRNLPSHTYLQYTATPQAPLLISKIDSLSPDFGAILEPGSNYVGGKEFFNHNQELIFEIPDTELPGAWQFDYPPPSLEESLQMFFILAANQVHSPETSERRSMMIHPSQTQTIHDQYYSWVNHIKNSWQKTLIKKNSDREELIAEFQKAYNKLKGTCDNLHTFENILEALPHTIKMTLPHKMNSSSGRTPQPEWYNALFHILVGGQAMDRGFTVEGLVITYMPRGAGVRNADTIQQRARFFGYKKSYLGECRVFLERDVIGAFTDYVAHEQDLRDRLLSHIASGKSMKDWKREFFLSLDLRPTRNSVITNNLVRGVFSNKWFKQDYPASGGTNVIEANTDLVNHVIQQIQFEPFEGHKKRTREQIHHLAEVPLKQLFENFLVDYRVGHWSESLEYSGLLLQIQNRLQKNPEETALVIKMSPKEPHRIRGVEKDGKVKKLFQGANPNKKVPAQDIIYPGDDKIREDGILCVQIHWLQLRDENKSKKLYDRVPTLAIWTPSIFAADFLVQDN